MGLDMQSRREILKANDRVYVDRQAKKDGRK
jgi:hypothetical protein